MNNTKALTRIKKALTDLENANHARLLVTVAATYADQGAEVEKAVLSAVLEMLHSQTAEIWENIKRQLKHQEDPADAVTLEEAILQQAAHYAADLLAKFPSLERDRVEKDLTAAATIAAAAGRKACFARLEQLTKGA